MPRTLAQNAQYIANTIKPAIKSAIEAQGVTVPSTDSFLDYADRIGEIEGGGSGYQLKDLPSGAISTVTDAAPLPLNALKVSVEAWQEGSGDPSPSNIRPIHGWDSGEIGVVGKNLFDKNANDVAVGYYLIASTGVLTESQSGYNTSGYIPIEPNTNYTKSGASVAVDEYCFYDSTKTFISGFSRANTTVLSPNNAAYMRFDYKASETDNIQIEFGTTATTYEPYQGTTRTVDFGRDVYGGSANLLTGEGDGTFDSIDLGSLNWTYNNAYKMFYTAQISDLINVDNHTVYNMICEAYKPLSDDLVFDGRSVPQVNGAIWSTAKTLRITNFAYTDANELKASLVGVKLVYQKLTPSNFTFAPIPTTKMLQGTNNLYADCGEVIEGEYFIGETKAYDFVEYIESDGTQVIDTGRQAVQGQTIEMTFEGSSNQTAYAWIFGGITSSDYYGYQFPNSSTIYTYNGGTSASSQSGFSSNVLTQKALTFNGNANANIHILGLWDGSAYSNKGKFKVYFLDINGDYFVPAKRRSDGVYGLYDIANSQFLTDVASGNALTGGNSLGIRIG